MKVAALTALAMLAFAANSLLCRAGRVAARLGIAGVAVLGGIAFALKTERAGPLRPALPNVQLPED